MHSAYIREIVGSRPTRSTKMKKNKNKKYYIWKTNSSCEPIEGSNRILEGPSERWIIKHIAHENGIKVLPNAKLVRLENGDMWFAEVI